MKVNKCPKCGKEFECCSKNNCWCEKFKVNNNNLEVLKKNYDGCLCSNCLKEYCEK